MGGRRTAWAENTERLRRAATTEPGRLRIIGAVLAVLVVAFGALTAWQMTDRSDAADGVLYKSQPLTRDAADIYRALAEANTAASSAFLAGGQETPQARRTYEDSIDAAARKLVTAANSAEQGSPSAQAITKLNTALPVYKGLVERARTYNRMGFPVGGAYLRYANQKMQDEMLTAAQSLYDQENARLDDDYDAAKPYPWAAITLGVLALAALAGTQVREYRRTNRVLSHGLVAAAGATTVVLLWLVVGHSVARAELTTSYDHGVRSLKVLHDARIAALKARGNENLTLISRGAETVKVGKDTKDKYDVEYGDEMGALVSGLTRAETLADDKSGRTPVTSARQSVNEWKSRHAEAREADENGNYEVALKQVVGSGETTDDSFGAVDKSLEQAISHEQLEFKQAARDGRGAFSGLPLGAGVLAVLAAAGAVLGIGRRLSEFR
ncbi:hypothetical protein DF268_18625 [Streptomyces sp. V2]|uniref:hypothetical protein n=1 Tax=Streptomyces TaxID=1883 RepID=UPI0006EB87B5|nr:MULTISPECIES: hypothetical protein [Streptomyces]PWG11975.1 hypothetical protein DF268_18625 [Streptomyces sp. V2]QZZ27871.1 hypothetical protein A7X85_17690 [Streptomyces sp. ST1015]